MKKNTQTTFNFVKLTLLVVSCLFTYLIWSSLNNTANLPVANYTNNKSNTVTINTTEEQLPEPLDISNFDEIVNRPLFFEGRKPFVYVEPEKPATKPRQKKSTAPKKTEQYSLNAVIITSAKQLAIIQTGREKALQRLSLGESIDDWTLEKIEPRSILLKKGNETKSLELEIKTSKAPKKKTANKAKTGVAEKKTASKTAPEAKKDNAEKVTPGA